MIKQSIRLVGGIIALFALILVFKHSHLMQEEKPLNTTERFNIAVLSTTISEEWISSPPTEGSNHEMRLSRILGLVPSGWREPNHMISF